MLKDTREINHSIHLHQIPIIAIFDTINGIMIPFYFHTALYRPRFLERHNVWLEGPQFSPVELSGEIVPKIVPKFDETW